MDKKIKCMYCMGTGKRNSDTSEPKKPCPICKGTGEQIVKV